MVRGRTTVMGVWLALSVASLLLLSACSANPPIDEEFPPGDPVLGDNPVLGSEGPGAIADADGTNYVLLTVLALCLIGAGVLLIKLERWERRRSENGAAA